MIAEPEPFAEAAEALVGKRFVLHGRNPEHGLDCVGLVAAALRKCGTEPRIPAGYGLRNASLKPYLSLARANAFVPAADFGRTTVLRGDLLCVVPGPGQSHLLIALGSERFVHAHAGLRRVVFHDGPLDWTVAHHWRLCAS